MKNLTSHKTHALLLMSGVTAMIGMTMMTPQTARADNYKAGAVVLGVLAGVLAAKGQTGPAVLAGAGAYCAYSQSQNDCYDSGYYSYHNDHNYSYNDHHDGRRYDSHYDNGHGRNYH